ncbi:MAG: hypothetical protein Q9160_006702 [Pyrenula sp. 1 TL-2023]
MKAQAPLPSPAPEDSPPSVLSSVGVDPSLAAQSSQHVGRSDFTCKVLDFLFHKNETFTPSSPEYNPLVQEAYTKTCWLTPACIVTPDTAQDVSKIIRILQVLQTKFAIRSGGDGSVPGFNSIDNSGVLIALQNLNKLSISDDLKTLTTGPGNRWGDVYNFASKSGKSIVGGRVPKVGVAGCLLGGCLTAFYNTVGQGLDSVSRFEIVLPDGSIKQASATSNTDLFRALKGGLTNLGIVTEFDLLTNSYNNIYYEIYLYAPSSTPALLTAYANYLTSPTLDPKSQVSVQVQPTYTLLFLGYIGQPASRPSIFSEFHALPPQTTIAAPTNSTIPALLEFNGAGNPAGTSTYTSAFSHKVTSPDFFLASYATYLSILETVPQGITFTYQPQGVTPNLVDAADAASPGVPNLLNIERTPQAWVDIFAAYQDSSQDAAAAKAADDFVDRMTKKANDEGVFLPFVDVNNGNEKLRPLRGRLGDNFDELVRVARKYDPREVMQRLQNDGYKYSKEL